MSEVSYIKMYSKGITYHLWRRICLTHMSHNRIPTEWACPRDCLVTEDETLLAWYRVYRLLRMRIVTNSVELMLVVEDKLT